MLFLSFFFPLMALFYCRRYYGEFSEGMPSGDGRFTFKDGSVYSRADHNGILSPSSDPQTPATAASSRPSESSHNDCSPLSNMTMSPVLSTTAKKGKDQPKNDSIDNTSIDIPALNETNKEVPDPISLDGEPALRKDGEEVVVEASDGKELSSGLLPYKRGPSIPNVTSFSSDSNDMIHIPAQHWDDVSVAKSVDSNISAQSVESGEAGKYKGQIVAGVPHGLGSSEFITGANDSSLLNVLHCLS